MNSATNPVPSPGEKPLGPRPTATAKPEPTPEEREFIRAENEDDDGYDPYSDRRPVSEPLFERDPWAQGPPNPLRSKTKPPGRNQMRPGGVLLIWRQTRSTSRLPTYWT